MSEFKDLNLDRERIDDHIQQFAESSGLRIAGITEPDPGKKKRVEIGRPGEHFATVDLHLVKTGTTTIQYKTGKNHDLGKLLAEFLKSTIDPNEFENVNLSLKGFTPETVDEICEFIGSEDNFSIGISQDEPNRRVLVITHNTHGDKLTLTHHKTTRLLQIQGRPLSCYRTLTYVLTEYLDLAGLEQIYYRRDDGAAEVVRKEVAADYLAGNLPHAYSQLPETIRKLLLSSCCVKLGSPQLPDYCMLLYPDLRSLEGVLKEIMAEHGMALGESEHGFGDFFSRKNGGYILNSDYEGQVNNPNLIEALNEAYTVYNLQRHGLFHMEDYADASRMVDTLEKAIALSKDIYAIIDRLYAKKM